jgi:hypothetical protein
MKHAAEVRSARGGFFIFRMNKGNLPGNSVVKVFVQND